MDPKIGARIRQVREAKGISLRSLARSAGIQAASLSRIETSITRRPHPSTVRIIATVLGVEVDELNGRRVQDAAQRDEATEQ